MCDILNKWLNTIQCMDCLEGMKQLPDKCIDLVLTDPPYGIDACNDNRFGTLGKSAATVQKDYKKSDWDKKAPLQKVFNEIFRISKNQIIWGMNYLDLKGGAIVWNKDVPEGYSKSKCEIAYKSYGVGVDYYFLTWNGMIQYDMKQKEKRYHPTQKPVKLGEWLLEKYSKSGEIILDPFAGSGSFLVAAQNLGHNYIGFEISEEYCKIARERTKYIKQGLF